MRQASYLNLVTETDLRTYDGKKDKLMQTKVLRVKQFGERGYYKTTNYRTTILCVYIVIFVFHILFRDPYYFGRVSKKDHVNSTIHIVTYPSKNENLVYNIRIIVNRITILYIVLSDLLIGYFTKGFCIC